MNEFSHAARMRNFINVTVEMTGIKSALEESRDTFGDHIEGVFTLVHPHLIKLNNDTCLDFGVAVIFQDGSTLIAGGINAQPRNLYAAVNDTSIEPQQSINQHMTLLKALGLSDEEIMDIASQWETKLDG